MQARQSERAPLLLDECKLTESELRTMGEMFADPALQDRSVKKLRELARVAPPPPSAAVQQAMRNIPIYQGQTLPQRPAWLSPVCWHRAFFQNCALRFATREGNIWVKFLYATQSPIFAAFCVMQEEEHYVEMVQLSASNWDAVGAQHYQHRFTMDFGAIRPWHELPLVAEDAIHVVKDVHYLSGTSWASVSELVPLPEVLSWLPEPSQPQQREKQSPKVPPQAEAEILAKHPFLKAFVESQEPPSTPSPQSNRAAQKEETTESGPLTDDQLQEVFDAMERKRQEWADDEVPYDGEFKVSLVGGAWLMKQRGAAFDAWRGAVRQGSPAEAWCVQYMLPQTASFSINLYTEQEARAMAQGWCHRMYYFFSLWQSQGDPGYKFTDQDVAAYKELPAFAGMARNASGAQLARIEKIRAIRPF